MLDDPQITMTFHFSGVPNSWMPKVRVPKLWMEGLRSGVLKVCGVPKVRMPKLRMPEFAACPNVFCGFSRIFGQQPSKNHQCYVLGFSCGVLKGMVIQKTEKHGFSLILCFWFVFNSFGKF
jgi:hypothetical protein